MGLYGLEMEQQTADDKSLNKHTQSFILNVQSDYARLHRNTNINRICIAAKWEYCIFPQKSDHFVHVIVASVLFLCPICPYDKADSHSSVSPFSSNMFPGMASSLRPSFSSINLIPELPLWWAIRNQSVQLAGRLVTEINGASPTLTGNDQINYSSGDIGFQGLRLVLSGSWKKTKKGKSLCRIRMADFVAMISHFFRVWAIKHTKGGGFWAF